MSINELEKQVTELKELQRMAEDLNAEITAGAFKIRWKSITSKRLDGKALKAAHADLYARYSVENTTRRFSIA